MLDMDLRRAILSLQAKGYGVRAIARALGISRNTVRDVLASGLAVVPPFDRSSQADVHLERIRQLHDLCAGNLVRVQEKLVAEGIHLGYSTLTAFCRHHKIGVKPPERAGRYDFGPGEEMQHDTSPHRVTVAGLARLYHCAALVLCYAHVLFAQLFPRWSRFECKVFLTQALEFFDGAAQRCMVDNHSVVIARGTGRDAIVAPEMVAFAERFRFVFQAHAVGDANRSARVERPFHYIEHNFYPGREFSDLRDLNQQLVAWCFQVNAKPKKTLQMATPLSLFAIEKPHLRALPLHVPEVYEVHVRMVDLEGYVSLHRNRYSVEEELIGQQVDVRETADRIRILHHRAEVAVHERIEPGAGLRSTLPQHRYQARRRDAHREPPREEVELRRAGPELNALVDALQRKYGGRAVRPLRQLHRLFLEYPDTALRETIVAALRYGLVDLKRIERMVLRRVAGEFFRLRNDPEDEDPSDG